MTVVREVPRTLDALLVALCAEARILPAITPLNAKSERERLIASLLRGEMPIPAWQYANRPVSRRAYDFLKEARELTAEVELSEPTVLVLKRDRKEVARVRVTRKDLVASAKYDRVDVRTANDGSKDPEAGDFGQQQFGNTTYRALLAAWGS